MAPTSTYVFLFSWKRCSVNDCLFLAFRVLLLVKICKCIERCDAYFPTFHQAIEVPETLLKKRKQNEKAREERLAAAAAARKVICVFKFYSYIMMHTFLSTND